MSFKKAKAYDWKSIISKSNYMISQQTTDHEMMIDIEQILSAAMLNRIFRAVGLIWEIKEYENKTIKLLI